MSQETVESSVYSTEYFSQRCGGIEFFQRYGHKVLKPSMQFAVKVADVRAGDRILDVGCGRGELVAHLDEKGCDAIGIDYARDAIEIAQRHYPKGKFQVVRSDEQLFGAASFNKIFLLGTIEHLYEHEIEKTLSEIKRLLKPGGVCVITTCTNSLYYKTLSYSFRRAVAAFLCKMGIPVKPPRPPRSEEDETMHINEKNYFTLKKSFSAQGFVYKIIPRPNPKLSSMETYGPVLPSNFPLKVKAAWKQWFYRWGIFHFPVTLFLARSHAAVLKVPK